MKKKTVKILIIDDNPADSNLLKRYFSKLDNWEVQLTITSNSDDGVKRYNAENQEIIIVDYLLGNDNGIDIIKKYKDLGFRAEYILLTGYGSETVVTDALRAGASDYLNKSALTSQVLDKTLRHLHQKIESENKIKKTESKLSYILEKTSTGLVIMDENGIILEANDSFLNMVGINSLDVLVGRKMTDWSSTESAKTTADAIAECKENQAVTDVEITFEKPGGQDSYILMNALLERENEENKIFAICRDITERKLYEKQLKDAKIKAEEADKLKSAFLANMSHEIRTPMNAIVGFADLLGRAELKDEERETYIKIIKSSSNSLLGLINDIIDLSKIEVERININKIEFSLQTVLLELYSSYSSETEENVQLIFDNQDETDSIRLTTDPLRFKQVFTNLIDNALKFTDKGTVNFGYSIKSKSKIQFYVKDTGIGIPKSKQEIIFDRFRKLEEDSSKLYRGTGLGLTISKKLIELLGGRIWLESEQNQGATFYFDLPLNKNFKSEKKEKESLAPITIEDIDWKKNTVLIVEDEDLNYLFLEKLLKPTKIKIHRAQTGIEAIQLSKDKSGIDIILMDIKLPELDGIEATKEIKKIHPEIPIIAQTAFAMKGDEEKFMEAGCDDYISKPLKAEKLLNKLNHYLSAI
jgi:PAS domain S-box-containing protein